MDIIKSWLKENDEFLAELNRKTNNKCRSQLVELQQNATFDIAGNDPFEFHTDAKQINSPFLPMSQSNKIDSSLFKQSMDENSVDLLNASIHDLLTLDSSNKNENLSRSEKDFKFKISNEFDIKFDKKYYYGDFFPSPMVRNKKSNKRSFTSSRKKSKASFDFQKTFSANEEYTNLNSSLSGFTVTMDKMNSLKINKHANTKRINTMLESIGNKDLLTLRSEIFAKTNNYSFTEKIQKSLQF